jgi:hypothetical protein
VYVAAVKNSMAAPQEVKQEYHDPAIPLPSIYTEEN